MKRVWFYALALVVALLLENAPFSGTDVGKLLPVELILLDRDILRMAMPCFTYAMTASSDI